MTIRAHREPCTSTDASTGGHDRAVQLRAPVCAVCLIVLHVAILVHLDFRNSPIATEPGHIAAGYSHWRLNRFDLLSVNPPLVRSVAAVALVVLGCEEDWRRYDDDPRQGHIFGNDWLAANGKRSFRLITWGRLLCIPFSVLGAAACYRWGCSAFGRWSGVFGTGVWCLSPLLVGHAALILPDLPAAAMALAAAYSFRQWLLRQGWRATAWLSLWLGLAQLTKLTLLVLYPLWFLLWIGIRLFARRRHDLGREACMLSVAFLGSLVVLNLGYTGEGLFEPLGSYTFHSKSLSGVTPHEVAMVKGGNRFAGTTLASLRVPLPRAYLRGLDKQLSDFDVPQASFLAGEYRRGGWLHYYLLGLILKTPLALLLLFLLAVALSIRFSSFRGNAVDEVLLVLHFAAILTLVSVHTAFNHHLRYALPAVPFACVWVGKVARVVSLRLRSLRIMVAGFTAWFMVASLAVHPHQYAYFNELIGGPSGGPKFFSESNVAWGQDVGALKEWLDAHQNPAKLYLHDHLPYTAWALDMRWGEMPAIPLTDAERPLAVVPGRYVINVCYLYQWMGAFDYLLALRPVAKIGWSYNIYEISAREAERLQREFSARRPLATRTDS